MNEWMNNIVNHKKNKVQKQFEQETQDETMIKWEKKGRNSPDRHYQRKLFILKPAVDVWWKCAESIDNKTEFSGGKIKYSNEKWDKKQAEEEIGRARQNVYQPDTRAEVSETILFTIKNRSYW